MKMLKLGLIALGLIISTVSYSQEKVKKTPEERAIIKTEKMAKELLLSNEQKQKVLTLNTGIAQKNEAVRKNTSLSKEQKENALMGNHKARIEQMKLILNEAQYTKFLANEQEKELRHEKMKDEREKQKNHKNKLEEKEENHKETIKEKTNELNEIEEEL